MGVGIWFWVIYVICVILGIWLQYPFADRRVFGTNLVVWVLIGLLGWGVFGPPIHG